MKRYLFAGGVMSAVMVALTGAMTAGTVLAADLPVTRAPIPAPPPDPWTGFYVGIHGGWGFGDVDFRGIITGNAILGENEIDHFTMSGGLVGGHIGYNWQMGYTWLIGIEASGTWSGVKKTIVSPFFVDFPDDRWSTEVRWLATVTPRIGITISSWMWYLKGGVAFADIRHVLESPTLTVDSSDTKVGWTAGFGGELLLGRNWVFGVEGNYYNFGSMNVGGASANPNFPDHERVVSMWSILGRVSYKFGGPSGAVAARY